MNARPDPRQFADADEIVAGIIADALLPPPPVDLCAWIEDNIVFDHNEPIPGPYRLDNAPFFRRILEVLSPEHAGREVTLKKSAQLGGTILGDGFLLGWLDLVPTTLMCVHPSLPQGKLWVNNKIKPHVRKSESLKSLLSFDNPKDAKATELLFERLDARGGVIVTGANSAASLSQHTVKAQLQDDLSKWEMNSGGDPEDQADSRSQAYEDAKIFKVGTPLIDGSCRIDRNFKLGTQEHYHVPCPHCGHMQPLDWQNMQANLDRAGDASGAFFTCTSGNGCVIEERDRSWCIDPVNGAQWVAHNPSAKRLSFYIWSAYAMLMSWGRIAERYFAAKGDPAKEQTFLNDVAGHTYKLAGEAPEWEEVQKRGDASDFMRQRIGAGYYFVYAGSDVQADRVEIGVWAFGPNLRRQPVDHIVVPGNIADAATRAALDKVMAEQTWPDAYGNARSIEHLFIDVGYERVQVLDWVKRYPATRITPIVGAQEDNAPTIGTQETRRPTRKGKRVKADRVVFRVGGSLLKGFLYSDLRKHDPLERGFVALGQGFDAAWYEQMCSERRQPTKNRRGFTVYRWVLMPGKRNEVLDCAVYAHAAAELLGWKRLTDAQWEAIAAERDQAPTPKQTDLFSVDQAETVRPIEPQAVPALPAEEQPPEPEPQTGDGWLGGTSNWL